MKNVLKTLLTAVVLTASASTTFAESYLVNSIDGDVKISVSLQSAGTANIPGPGIALPPGGTVKQSLMLHEDHTMTGAISYSDGVNNMDLFRLSGIWYRPEGSKVIYYAVDGDPTKGAASDGTWGALFDPGKATLATLQDFMPLLFSNKVLSVSPIYPTIGLKTGIIKLTLNKNGDITKASSNMTIVGRAMVTYCKMDKAPEPSCSISKGTKDASFSFSSITKSTVGPLPPL